MNWMNIFPCKKQKSFVFCGSSYRMLCCYVYRTESLWMYMKIVSICIVLSCDLYRITDLLHFEFLTFFSNIFIFVFFFSLIIFVLCTFIDYVICLSAGYLCSHIFMKVHILYPLIFFLLVTLGYIIELHKSNKCSASWKVNVSFIV